VSLRMLFLSLFILGTSSCGSLRIPDVEVCLDKGKDAFCTTTLSRQEKRIHESTWKHERIGRLSLDAHAWGEIEKALRKACELVGNKCVKDVKEVVETMKRMRKRSLKLANKGKGNGKKF
jgi:hypothetical protein